MKKYIVYKHTCIENNKVYIGITCCKPIERWGSTGKNYSRHNPHFWSAIQKYGWIDGFKHEILYSGLTKEEAEQKEIELIQKYNSTDRNFGYNILSGGNCTSVPSAETRLKRSRALKQYYENNPMSEEAKKRLRDINLGQKRTDEARKHMSESAKKRKHLPMKEETKRKISKANKGRILSDERKQEISDNCSTCVIVKQYDLQGNFIKEYKSARFASKCINGDSSKILNCCYGKLKTAYGYQWRTKENPDKIDAVVFEKKAMPVAQYDLDGNLLKIYDNASLAAKAINGDASTIIKCCRGKLHKHRNFIWKYYN